MNPTHTEQKLPMEKATRRQIKEHNDRLILKTIYDQGELSRADVARLTGLTPTTVSDSVAGWMDDGLVAEVGVRPSAGGKPPILLRVVDDSRHLIGVDLANGAFAGAIVNLRGQIQHRRCLPVYDRGGDAALEVVFELLDGLVDSADGSLLGIGIGAPGLMDARRGMVRNAVNLDWHNLPLGSLLEERYRLPVYIANDCQASALAECTFGSARQVSNLILIWLGLGIGAGVVLNRALYYGDGFGAGEIGHVKVVDEGELCRCGHYGCLETVASSRAIVRQARAIAARDPNSLLHRYAPTADQVDLNAVFHALQAGDQEVKGVITGVGKCLGEAMAHLVCSLNIQRIILAGSMARFGRALIDPIREQVKQGALAALADETRVEFTTLDPDIVILGAAALLLAYELELV